MNCQLFEELIVDLVRENSLEDAVRSQALGHAASCVRCAALLEAQRSLTSTLKLAGAEDGDAPVYVEASLLAAYRARRAQMPREGDTSRPPGLIAYVYWGIAAALCVVLLGWGSFRLLQMQLGGPVTRQAQTAATFDTPQAARIEPVPAPAAQKLQLPAVVARLEPAAKRTAPGKPVAKTQPVEGEIATDFFPLTSGTEIATMESGQIVRVLLPRNAMAAYGLPVNQERLDEPVSAQVLIGQDGVARAIRFLGTQNSNFFQTGMRSRH